MSKQKNSILFREIAEKLWNLLDDIDTASDIYKPSDEKSAMSFYKYAMKKQAERHKYLKSDGYKLYTSEEFEKLPKPEHKTMSKQTAVQWLVEQVNSDCLNSTFIRPELVKEAIEIENKFIQEHEYIHISKLYDLLTYDDLDESEKIDACIEYIKSLNK